MLLSSTKSHSGLYLCGMESFMENTPCQCLGRIFEHHILMRRVFDDSVRGASENFTLRSSLEWVKKHPPPQSARRLAKDQVFPAKSLEGLERSERCPDCYPATVSNDSRKSEQ